ncbi:hypothetical protein ACHAWF_002566 [Thalassiosira exigua]
MSSKSFLKESLGSLGLPPGLVSEAYHNYQRCEARYWLLDNSQPMNAMDSHLGRPNEERGSFDRIDGIMRWEELEECVRFHADMASRCWIPSTYRLVNDPRSGRGEWRPSRGFELCMGRSRDVPSEMRDLHDALTNVPLDQRRCPLRHCVQALVEDLEEDADRVSARDRHFTVIICTQGRPTTKEGGTGERVLRDFEEKLAQLSELPVKIIVRLCTDTEEVRDMYNTMDSRFDCIDVLDDFWGEVRVLKFLSVLLFVLSNSILVLLFPHSEFLRPRKFTYIILG